MIIVGTVLLSSLVASAALGAVSQVSVDTACILMNTDRMPLSARQSPLDSLTFTVAASPVKICYSRPSARGRTMIGGSSVPYGRVWRTGANEPTMIHTTVPLMIAGIYVPRGSYSLYTVPDEDEWQVIVNTSISQWGHERFYTEEVRAQELGRGEAPAERTDNHVETFTIQVEGEGDNVVLILEWERTQVMIPIMKAR